MTHPSNINNDIFDKQNELLSAYRASAGYTITGLLKAIEILKDSCNLNVPEGVREIYKKRIVELESYLSIIEKDC